jgi:MOSC domain-containing protein YiiM
VSSGPFGTVGALVSVRAGRIRRHDRPEWDKARTRTWDTAFWKDQIDVPVRVGRLGLEGDVQADTRVHGGPEMAVLMYADSNHAFWRTLPGLEGMGPGGFGENLTVSGLSETSVCVGDVLEIGSTRLEVSSPRGPCAAISRRWNAEWLLKRVRAERRTGWYLRVLEEGDVRRGDEIHLASRPHPKWTVDRLLALRFITPRSLDELSQAAALPQLAPEWRDRYARLPALD